MSRLPSLQLEKKVSLPPLAAGVVAQGLQLWTTRWVVATILLLVVYWLSPLSLTLPSFLRTDFLSGQRLELGKMAAALWGMLIWLIVCFAISWVDAARIAGPGFLRSTLQSALIQFRGKRPIVFAGCLLASTFVFVYEYDAIRAVHPLASNFVLVALVGAPLIVLRPPLALFLCESGKNGQEVAHVASSALFPLRGVTLLDAKSTRLPLHMSGEDNLRQFNNADWETRVQKLMDQVALVVIDGRGNSKVVSRELQWILSSTRRSSNSILITSDDGSFGLSMGYRDGSNISRVTQCTLSALPFAIWQLLKR